jgi:hypothetical protein
MADEIRQAEVLTDEEKQLLFGWGENIFDPAHSPDRGRLSFDANRMLEDAYMTDRLPVRIQQEV